MSRSHHIDRIEKGTLASGQQPPQVQARNLHQDGKHAPLCLYARRETNGAEQTTTLERGVRAAIAVFPDAVDHDVEATRHDARKILMLVVDRSCAKLSDESPLLASRGSPQLEAGQPPEHEQRLTDCAGGAVHEDALASLHPGCSVQELIRGRPAQD